MPFDQKTRNLLQRTVSACRTLLTDECAAQRRSLYGIDDAGVAAPLDILGHLSDEDMQIARLLRERLDHLVAGLVSQGKSEAEARKEAVHRLTREQAFTILNRLAALRMAEERGIVLECVRQGVHSEGFELFLQSAGSAFGDRFGAYRAYLSVLFDELAIDLGILFSRWDPMGLVFPRPDALEAVLKELNGTGTAAAREGLTPRQFNELWAEDETIGWIYQYYNDEAERKKMREESSAPRNSRELAVRNQFFTPRYVVEFLTDNTLGRLWYEMSKGKTRLREQCRYLVRRPVELFLPDPMASNLDAGYVGRDEMRRFWQNGQISDLPDNPDLAVVMEWIHRMAASAGFEAQLAALGTQHQEVMDTVLNPAIEGRTEHLATTHPLILMHCLWRIGVQIARSGSDDMRRPIAEDTFDNGGAIWRALLANLRETAEPPSQEQLLQRPVVVAHRPIKDPRTILMLDPACGSMHFGLYAFDLFEVIYDEAWDLEETLGADALSRPPGIKPLHDSFAGKNTFLQEVPRLIIEHNLHGIDIDPRCAQIAGLSLWLRAQKSWQRLGLQPAERPTVKRSNIVCAEPMPGERELLREFVEREFPAAERAVCLRLLEAIFDKMQLAGEAGSLLKIEEEIRSAIEDAREAWQKLATKPQELFTTTELNQIFTAPELTGLEQAVSSLTTAPRHLATNFWELIEERIYAALRDYAEQAENGGGFQRRLFAEDAARGFAFIDVCRKRYDVALMNPPFGDTTEVASAYLAANFGKFSNNLLCSFFARGRWLCPGGAVGSISDSTWLKKADYEVFREFLLAASNGLRSLIDLGWGVLDDANVATCCFTSIASDSTDNRVTSIRAVELDLDHKEPAILAALTYIKGEGLPSRAPAFVRNLSFFEKFPGKAIAYETHDALVPLFLGWKPLDPEFATTRRGYTPGDTFRFFRCWWEVFTSQRGNTWWTLNNGGAFAPVVGDGFFVSLHETDWASYRPLTGFRLESEQWFGKAGLGWGKRTDFMYVYPLPAGSMFSHEGHTAFPTQAHYTWPLIAFLNSDVGQTLLVID